MQSKTLFRKKEIQADSQALTQLVIRVHSHRLCNEHPAKPVLYLDTQQPSLLINHTKRTREKTLI